MNEYFYDDWYNGKVYLETCKIKFRKVDENNIGVNVNWTNFSETESNKIKKKQQEIYDSEIIFHLEKFKNNFLNGFNNSELKNEFLQDEINDFHNLLFDFIPDNSIPFDLFKGRNHIFLPFLKGGILLIQNFINDKIKQGKKINTDFIHSPNYLYQVPIRNEFPTEVYALVSWKYLKWLKDFNSEKNIQSQSQIIQNIESENSVFYWQYGIENLTQIENAFLNANFINSKNQLIPAFYFEKVTLENRVNWIGEQGALIYFIYRVGGNTSLLMNFNIYKFASERFMINGKSKTPKQFSSLLSNIIRENIQKKNMTPILLQIDNILKRILKK